MYTYIIEGETWIEASISATAAGPWEPMPNPSPNDDVSSRPCPDCAREKERSGNGAEFEGTTRTKYGLLGAHAEPEAE